MTLLVTFPGSAETSAQHVGGKANSLIRMAAAGHRVPPGAVLTTEFFAPWFAEIQASSAWKAFRGAEPALLAERCAELQSLVVALEWDATQRRALGELEGFLSETRNGRLFAVRSSSPDEDTATGPSPASTRLGSACLTRRSRARCVNASRPPWIPA